MKDIFKTLDLLTLMRASLWEVREREVRNLLSSFGVKKMMLNSVKTENAEVRPVAVVSIVSRLGM